MTSVTNQSSPLIDQLSNRFNDENYAALTEKEMTSPHCLSKPVYIVGNRRTCPALLKKIAHAAKITLGTVLIVPAIYWTVKSGVEIALLPISSRVLKWVAADVRDYLPKTRSQKVILAVSKLAKVAFATAGCVYLGLDACIVGACGFAVYTAIKKLIIDEKLKKISTFFKRKYRASIKSAPKHMRFTVRVKGQDIDVYVSMGNDQIKAGQRWILATNGNLHAAEQAVILDKVFNPNSPTLLTHLQKDLKANIISFNYGGCLGSKGSVSAKKTKKVYRAIMQMLEDNKGLVAGSIVMYGHSIGGLCKPLA